LSIRTRLLLLILFATLIPALVSGMQFLERRDSEIAAARRDLAAMARQVAQDLKDTVRGTAQLHFGLSRARDLDTQDRAACSDFLANVLKEYPQYTGILTITPKGDLFCDSLRTGRKLNLTDRRYFQQALTSENPLAVEPAFGRLTGIAVLQIAYAARRETGEPRFVLLASLNLEKTMQSRSRTLPRQNAVIALVDGKGTVLTWHPGGEKLRGTSIADSPLFRFARERQGEEVREDIEFGGASRIWAAGALPEFPAAGLHILVGVSKNDLLAAANRNLNQALATLVVVWLLVFAGAWMLVEFGVRRQAARIIAAVARFSGGDFGARIGKPYPRGEIGNLMAALDHAFERQAQLYGALQQAYDDLRQTREAMLQQDRLRALGQMASGIAHDINNAISPVTVYTESLLEHEPNLSERARGYLQTIQRAAHDVAHTVSRMREFYRQREPQLILAQVQLNQLAEQVIELTRARWSDMPQQRGHVIRVHTEFAPDLPAVMGSESEIREALTNLVFNAVDAMPEGGTLTVRTRVAPLGVVIEVADTGVGMDEETRRRCFEPFFTTKGERGTGLGLAMVYGVVRRHSAEVEIESAVGRGTTVRLVFARISGSVLAVRPGAAQARPPRMRILLVDDDPLVLRSLRDALELDGHAVHAANGGEDGIRAFQASRERGEAFAVVITDLGMPYVDGRQVAAAVKAASASTPVILLTGWGQRLADDGEALPNVDHLLSKPPDLHKLRAVLVRCAERAGLR
jgi:signal transduction histidine kinase/CheY-like chemotaxis protein